MLVNCPKCNAQFDLSPDLYGVHIRCGSCNAKFQTFENGSVELLEDAEAFSAPDESLSADRTAGSPEESSGAIENVNSVNESLSSDRSIKSDLQETAATVVDVCIFFGSAGGVVICICILVLMLIFRSSLNAYFAEKNPPPPAVKADHSKGAFRKNPVPIGKDIFYVCQKAHNAPCSQRVQL